MGIAEILVPVTGAPSDKISMATAFAAAKPFSAHVKIAFSHADPRMAVPVTSVPLTPHLTQELVDAAQEVAEQASQTARQTLEEQAEAAGVRIVATPQSGNAVTASYLTCSGQVATCLDPMARLADLIVFPPLHDDVEMHDAFMQVLTTVQRPVLLSPDTAPAILGHKVAVGWDGGVPASHALTAALPYLKAANHVDVLSVQRPQETPDEPETMREYLRLHGISWQERILKREKQSVAELLLKAAREDGYDLLVIGGYGHSRLQEMLFGGPTADIIRQPPIPVFMMH